MFGAGLFFQKIFLVYYYPYWIIVCFARYNSIIKWNKRYEEKRSKILLNFVFHQPSSNLHTNTFVDSTPNTSCVLFIVHFILYVIEIQSEFMILQKNYILYRFINHLKIAYVCGLIFLFGGQMGNGRPDLHVWISRHLLHENKIFHTWTIKYADHP